MKDFVVGIDLGTGSAKAIALNLSGDVIDSAQVSYPTIQPQPGYLEQVPELIWNAFVECLSRITSVRGVPLAVSLSSAMHSTIAIDRDGNAMGNMIIWADNRSASFAREIHKSPEGKRIYEKSGTPIHAMTPLCKLRWLRHHRPEISTNAEKIVSIKEYVWFRLFGSWEVDYSIASATGLMDIEGLSWYDESLAMALVRPSQLSTLVNTDFTRKCINIPLCARLGVDTETPFIIGASDGCLANVGSFATEEGFLAMTIGTSGAVRVTQKKPMLNFRAMTFNYRLDEQTYVCGGPVNNGGVALKWYAENVLRKKLESTEDYDAILGALASTSPGAEGLIFLPYILGERAPIWNSDACGVFYGMRSHHQDRHFTRAVVEGISTSLYDITHNMIETGLDIKQLHVSGGFVQSEQWLQLIADLFGKKVCLVNSSDASAIGAAYLAMKKLGIIRNYEQLRPKKFTEYYPDPQNMDAYRELFLKYRKLYSAVAALMEENQSTN